jgi:glutamate--cysteine ligase
MLPLAVQAAMAAIEKICPEAAQPVGHSREPHAQHLLPEQRGAAAAHLSRGWLNVRIGSINPRSKKTTTIELPNGEQRDTWSL